VTNKYNGITTYLAPSLTTCYITGAEMKIQYTVLINKKLPYFTSLVAYFAVLSLYYLLLAQNHRANVALKLQPYFYHVLRTPHTKYWVWSCITQEKSAASSEHYFCLWSLFAEFNCCYSSPKQTTLSPALLVSAVLAFAVVSDKRKNKLQREECQE